MAPLQSIVTATLLFLSAAQAHFTLNAPPSFGFDEDTEDSEPCGGVTPNFDDKSKVTDFHVGGEPIAVKLGHTQSNWLYRATLGGSDSKNWTQLFPIVQQSGLGFFCEPSVTAPEAWVGKQGILSVIADAPDGLLFQVSRINWRLTPQLSPAAPVPALMSQPVVRIRQLCLRHGKARIRLQEQ